MMSPATLSYFYGDDAFGIEEAAADAFTAFAANAPGLERWRVSGDATTIPRIAERVGTASMFGGGTFVVIVDPAPLARTKDDRDALIALLGNVAPGNAIAFLETNDGSRRPAALDAIAKAVEALGGVSRPFKAPKEGELASWIERRAKQRGVALAPGAAREIALRVGGFVREGDVDRRRQGQLAVGELEKLALYRPGAVVSIDDVRALVPEVVPGSTWAFLDAVAQRRVARALELLERLFDATPELVVMAQLHRRVRELVEVADHLAAGASPGSLVRTLGLKPFRAEKLAEQARTWTQPELDAALDRLVELDAAIRGAPGAPVTEAQRRLAFVLWIGDRVGRAA